MTNRENMLKALRKDNPAHVPFEFVLCPSHIKELEKKTGTRNYMEYYGFPIRYVELNKTKKNTDFSKYYDFLPPDTEPIDWNPEWGIMGVHGSVAHFQEMLHPMAKFQTLDEIYQFPFPDFTEDYRWEGMDRQIQRLVENDLIAVAFMQMTIFEIAWYLRGLDNFMVDMVINTGFTEALLDVITKIRIDMAQRYAKAGVDILMLGDDVSTQLDMMMNPDLWRTMFKPRLARIIKSARDAKPDILIFYHGDGNLQKIIPDLIEIGVDILNPVQPECMDPIKINELYGDKLSFWGTLGTQTTLPYGTPQEVKETCRKLIKNVGKGGGLVLAPTHMVEPDVPFKNLQAFIDAVKEYGKY